MVLDRDLILTLLAHFPHSHSNHRPHCSEDSSQSSATQCSKRTRHPKRQRTLASQYPNFLPSSIKHQYHRPLTYLRDRAEASTAPIQRHQLYHTARIPILQPTNVLQDLEDAYAERGARTEKPPAVLAASPLKCPYSTQKVY